MGSSLRRLTAAFAALALTSTGTALAAEPPPSGPVYPPPGGVTLESTGDSGRPGGVTFSYSDLQLDNFASLMWSVHSESLPQLALDGAIDEPGETMTFSAAASDLAAGILVFEGEAALPGFGTYPTSATVRTTTPAGDPLPMVAAADAELPPAIGGAAQVTGDFKSNFLLRVAGQPAKDFFDQAQTQPGQEGDLRISTSGAFYYVPANELPAASFEWAPETPTAGRSVEFTSTSTDTDGEIVASSWDLDGDGNYDDATGPAATTSFAAAGDHEVGLRVEDDRGGVDTHTATLTVVPNEPPTVSIAVSPESPKATSNVTFTASASDADGEIVAIEWDLDDDGAYDDATGATASRTFAEAGEYSVGVRVTDDLGGTGAATATVNVRTCEPAVVSQTLRQLGATLGIEPTVRQLNCDLLEPLGL